MVGAMLHYVSLACPAFAGMTRILIIWLFTGRSAFGVQSSTQALIGNPINLTNMKLDFGS